LFEQLDANHEELIKVVKKRKPKASSVLNLRNGCLLRRNLLYSSMLKVNYNDPVEKFLKSVIKMVKFAEI
jgi:hypothetical protein